MKAFIVCLGVLSALMMFPINGFAEEPKVSPPPGDTNEQERRGAEALAKCFLISESMNLPNVTVVSSLQTSANLDAPNAHDLGVHYAVHLDHFNESVSWFRKAAAQCHASAQYNLGVFYSLGVGVDKDALETAKWYGPPRMRRTRASSKLSN